jgi:hypothetical protein
VSRFLAGGMALGFSTANIIPAVKTIGASVIDQKRAPYLPCAFGILFSRIARSDRPPF